MRQLFTLLLLLWASVSIAEVKLHEDTRYCAGGDQVLLLDMIEPAVGKPNNIVALLGAKAGDNPQQYGTSALGFCQSVRGK
jgi:hypothetical protein